MARTVVALYDTVDNASKAIRELVDNGFHRDDISMMAGDSEGRYTSRQIGTEDVSDQQASGAAQGAGVGASIGAALGGIGGLLVGLGALVIPGVGPVLAAGPLAAALAGLAGAGAGALAGGVTGGLIGALVDVGVPEETARYYSEGVRRGGTLVTVRTDDNMSGRAVAIMNRYNPVDINTRVSEWLQEGWTGFDTSTAHDTSRDQGSTGTVRSNVDTDLENTEDRYGVEQNIPTTGDRDQIYGSSAVRDQGYSGSRGTEFGTTGGRTDETGRSHEGNKPRGEDENISGREGRMSSTTGTDYDSTRMSDRDYGDRGMADTNYPGTRGYRPFSYYDTAFHNHFNSAYGTTYTYDQYQPAYRYGYDLATDDRYSNRDWVDIEPEARRYWEDREPGAWERMKDAVRHAWDIVRNKVD